MKPYYEDDAVTIYHGDCVSVLPQLEPVDLVLADPPYNHGIEYDCYDDARPPNVYAIWCSFWFMRARERSARMIVFPGHGNLRDWMGRMPSGVGCWYKPGNPAGGGVFQHCEWEPFLLWGRARGVPDVIRATVSEQSNVGNHPCPKPLALFRAIISKGHVESVIDPFMGSGTTLRAAKDLGVPAVGIEISERYCEIAAKRMGQEVLAL